MLLDDYSLHAIRYPHRVDDLSVPWVPSPATPARQLPPSTVQSPVSLLSSTSTQSDKSSPQRTKKTLQFHVQEPSSEKRKRHRLPFARSVSKWLKPWKERTATKVVEVEIEMYDPIELEPTAKPPIPLSDWKAWTYYAHPCVNDVVVNNLSPGPVLDVELDMQVMFDYLKSPGGTEHPERWIKGQKHPALPPRPAVWKRIEPNEIAPFPWELQLNPLLTHSIAAYPEYSPLCWQLNRRPTALLFYLTDNGELVYVLDNDLCQPATHPLVTHMYICAYAIAPDWNMQHKLPWPVMLQSRDGITCEDVLVGIYDNFLEHVKKSEFNKWDSETQRMAMNSHVRRPSDRDINDYMKRVDMFGSNAYFRGLAPSLNMEGWVLLLGPEPPMMRGDS